MNGRRLKDLAPVALVTASPFMLVVHPSVRTRRVPRIEIALPSKQRTEFVQVVQRFDAVDQRDYALRFILADRT